MERKNPVKPLIVGTILVAVFLVLNRVLPPRLPEDTAQWVSFFTVLLAILSAFICFIAFVSRLLGGRVPERFYGIIQIILIAGIVLGILGMFQPWVQAAYPIGFLLLFSSTWMFTLWGYVTPKPTHSME